jgi:hypothetical protein
MKNANELRTLVMNNALELGRLNAEQLGKADFAKLTELYRNALDALTDWASKDYAHTSSQDELTASFNAIKAILELFDDGETRIVIDQTSMRTMRDLATQPKRLYSDAYKKAEKARKAQAKTVSERYADLITLGASERNEDESIEDYAARIREDGIKTVVDSVDMLELYVNANVCLVVKEKAVQDIKDAGNWTWRRPVAVDIKIFADLVENYIADCLVDNYNIKSSATVRAEKAAERQNAKAEKDAKANA